MAEMTTFRDAVAGWAAGGSAGAVPELAARLRLRTAVLLEGPSDLAAVEALAARRGRDLAAEGVCALSMNGAMNAGHFARVLGPPGLGLRLTGLCDEREQPYYRRGLERAGAPGRDVFVCTADLEEELIRALGAERVEETVRAEGEVRAWQTFRSQPAQQGRPVEGQLRRFLGTRKGRKIHYGRVLTEALGPGDVPAPLEDLFSSL
ncbi:TOPRIM nucleotidyl transferase/hydrolase domain-containing protein [Streptomyces sp. NPDC002644]